jgi:hypothetical protein
MVSIVTFIRRREVRIVVRPAFRAWRVVRGVEREEGVGVLAAQALRQATVPATRGPEFLTMSTWTRTKPASDDVGSRPCSKARMRRRLE